MIFIAVIAMLRNKRLFLGLAFWVCTWLGMAMPAQAKTISQAAGNLMLTPSHGGGEAWRKANCNACHVLQRLHKTVPVIKAMVDKKKYATCTACHGSNGTSAARQCLVCHNVTDMPLKPIRTGKHRHDFNLLKDLPTTSGQCVVCHQAANMNGKFELQFDLTVFDDKWVGKQAYENRSEFCLRCHNKDHQQKAHPIIHAGNRAQAINAEEDFLKIDKHGVTDGATDGIYRGFRSGQYVVKSIVDCVDCHTMHGTTNTSLIIDDSRKGVFLLDKGIRNTPYSVEVFDKTDYSQLCVLCHSMTNVIDGGDTDTGNGLSGVHFNYGSACVTCHSHGERTQKGL